MLQQKTQRKQLEKVRVISYHQLESDTAIISFSQHGAMKCVVKDRWTDDIRLREEPAFSVAILDKEAGDFYQILTTDSYEISKHGKMLERGQFYESLTLEPMTHASPEFKLLEAKIKENIPCCGKNMSKVIAGLVIAEVYQSAVNDSDRDVLFKGLKCAGLSMCNNGEIQPSAGAHSNSRGERDL